MSDEFYYRCCGVIHKAAFKSGQLVKATRDGEMQVATFTGLVCPLCEAKMECVGKLSEPAAA